MNFHVANSCRNLWGKEFNAIPPRGKKPEPAGCYYNTFKGFPGETKEDKIVIMVVLVVVRNAQTLIHCKFWSKLTS